MPPDDFDDDAVQRLLHGDEEAFRVAYRCIQPGLVRYLGVLVGREDAEDVAAEAWAQAVRDLGRFSGGHDGFRGWITTIARHRGLDLLRSRGRRPLLYVPPEDLPERASEETVEDLALALTSTEAALDLIGTLPPDQAEAVLLRAVVGLDAASAGRVLGKRAGAVRTAAHRGLKTLAKKLSEEV